MYEYSSGCRNKGNAKTRVIFGSRTRLSIPHFHMIIEHHSSITLLIALPTRLVHQDYLQQSRLRQSSGAILIRSHDQYNTTAVTRFQLATALDSDVPACQAPKNLLRNRLNRDSCTIHLASGPRRCCSLARSFSKRGCISLPRSKGYVASGPTPVQSRCRPGRRCRHDSSAAKHSRNGSNTTARERREPRRGTTGQTTK